MSSEAHPIHRILWKHRFLPVLLFLVACGPDARHETELRGETMGTFYQVKLVTVDPIDEAAMRTRIEAELDRINALMSNWLLDSEISRFNNHLSRDPFTVSPDTLRVVSRALELSEATDGALDPTLSPLIELWGFGTREDTSFPKPDRIEAALETVGPDKLTVIGEALVKSTPELTVNLSAIAKGYAVDRVAAIVAEAGHADFMVNIGGEVRVKGKNSRDDAWRMAIEEPRHDSGQEIYAILDLVDTALATSGDYRRFFVHEGTRYAHIIDPRTGYPVRHHIASASVIAPDCMTADALATALLVLEPEKGMALIEAMDGIECLILVREGDDTLTEHASSGWDTYRHEQPE